jgi:hypothetical protein
MCSDVKVSPQERIPKLGSAVIGVRVMTTQKIKNNTDKKEKEMSKKRQF